MTKVLPGGTAMHRYPRLGRVRKLIKLLELVEARKVGARKAGFGHEAGWSLVGGNLKLRVVGSGVWIARVTRVGLGKQVPCQQRCSEQSKTGKSRHGSFYPAKRNGADCNYRTQLNAVALEKNTQSRSGDRRHNRATTPSTKSCRWGPRGARRSTAAPRSTFSAPA